MLPKGSSPNRGRGWLNLPPLPTFCTFPSSSSDRQGRGAVMGLAGARQEGAVEGGVGTGRSQRVKPFLSFFQANFQILNGC